MFLKLPQYRLLIFNSILLFALVGSGWAYRTERLQVIPANCLSRTPIPFRNWKTTELHLAPDEQGMLRPDAVLLRRYTSHLGESADLAVIAGHRKQTVHTPAFCMAGGGWETLSTTDWHVVVGNNDIRATRSILTRNGQELVATYFFTDGISCTRSLAQFQGRQLLKRLRGEMSVGALVRITVPVTRDRSAAERFSNEFARTVFPDVLQRLRSAQIK